MTAHTAQIKSLTKPQLKLSSKVYAKVEEILSLNFVSTVPLAFKSCPGF